MILLLTCHLILVAMVMTHLPLKKTCHWLWIVSLSLALAVDRVIGVVGCCGSCGCHCHWLWIVLLSLLLAVDHVIVVGIGCGLCH